MISVNYHIQGTKLVFQAMYLRNLLSRIRVVKTIKHKSLVEASSMDSSMRASHTALSSKLLTLSGEKDQSQIRPKVNL